jgi:hypothetical protein
MTMLADKPNIACSGRIDQDIHLPCTAKRELVEFIADALPRWRDNPDRPIAHAETTLTEHLCDYLNSAAHFSAVWNHIQFRTETGDETRGGRKIDLTVKPCGASLIIEGRRHSQFEALFPIECKRLPTPKAKDRDEREYVITVPGTTGGIQRFKFGHHGAAHTFAAMIAYVQEHPTSYWVKQVNSWIRDLSAEADSVWTKSDCLHLLSDDTASGLCALASSHHRAGGLDDCELRHLWITMK